MPYIAKIRRPRFDPHIQTIIDRYERGLTDSHILDAVVDLSHSIENEGDFNYVFSKIIYTLTSANTKYSTANWIMDVLDEVYLRFIHHPFSDHSDLGDILYELAWRARDYSKLHGIRGALRCIEHEYYTRKVRPYEDTKIGNLDHGDIE
ncbi:MAG: hypothetical protein R3321_10050 [Nitrososphaeraceae archaeon]|nr:hypothetical protein [Nitrososphaeraceae archaeon]